MHIDPAGVQLLFVDLQAFLTSLSATESPDMIGKAAGALARTATALGTPITFSLVPGSDMSPQPVPELQRLCDGGQRLRSTVGECFSRSGTSRIALRP